MPPHQCRLISAAPHTRRCVDSPHTGSPPPVLSMAGDMEFAASLLNPEGGTPGADSGEQTPVSPEQSPMDSGAQTPLQPDEEPPTPPNVGAGGAEGGAGGTKQLCRI